MDERAELTWGQSISKHPSVDTLVIERQRADPPPPHTPTVCVHLESTSLSMTSDLLVSESPWWMVTFPLFIAPLNHALIPAFMTTSCFESELGHSLGMVLYFLFIDETSLRRSVFVVVSVCPLLCLSVSWRNHTGSLFRLVWFFYFMYFIRSYKYVVW